MVNHHEDGLCSGAFAVSLRECTNWENMFGTFFKHRKVANPKILPSHIKGIIYINHETRILSFMDFMECAIRGPGRWV